jgi:putative DNA primase/helicase
MTKPNPVTASQIICGLRGNEYTSRAKCPAHDGTSDDSLYVSEGKDGKVLVHCKGGCSQDRVISELKSRGLWSSNCRAAVTEREFDHEREHQEVSNMLEAMFLLTVARNAEIKNPAVRGQMKPYFKGRGLDYVPECAMLLTAKQLREAKPRLKRYGPGLKNFPAIITPILGERGLQGAQLTYLSADMTKNLVKVSDPKKKSIRRFLGPSAGGYIIVRDLDPTQPLIIGESIEKAMSLSQVTGGVPAISALDAGNLPKVCIPILRELDGVDDGGEHREYIITADNDDAGRKGGEALKARLTNDGRKVRGPLYPPKKGDGWDDALHNCTDPEGWSNMILKAKAHKMKEVRSLTMSEFCALDFPKRKYLLEPWLTTSALAMIHAARGGAKTYLALSIAYAVATGTQLLGWDVQHSGKVTYVDGEMPGDMLVERLNRLGPHSENLRIVAWEQFQMIGQSMPNLATKEGRDMLDKIIEADDPVLVVLDNISTLVSTAGTGENDSDSWQDLQDWSMQHRRAGHTIMFIHHEGRSGNQRGTTRREDVQDVIVRLRKRTRDEQEGDKQNKQFKPVEGETSYEFSFTKGRGLSDKQLEPMVVRLSVVDNRIAWRHDMITNVRNERIKQLFAEGMKLADVAKELGLTKGRVSQLKKDLGIKAPEAQREET